MIALKSNAHFFELKVVGMSNYSHFSLSFFLRGALYGTLALLFVFSSAASAQVRMLPAPREVHFDGKTSLPARIEVSVPGHDAGDQFAASDLLEAVTPGSVNQGTPAKPASAAYRVVLLRADSVAAKALLAHQHLTFDPAMDAEGYVMTIESHQASIVAASGAGIFYGVQTFKQLLPLPGAERELPTGTVRDWPAMRYRGVQDDLSRGPVPTLEYELYQDAAETPHGHVLAPGQAATLPLIKDWFTQIAQEFPSPFMHIGADETWDLGRGRTQQQVETQGYGPVYVAFLKQIHDELAPLHRRLLFWGDIGGADPAAVAGLPKDMI